MLTQSPSTQHPSWRELPSADQVYEWLQTQASLRAAVRSAQLDISVEEARLGAIKPRDKAARFAGIGEDRDIISLRYRLVQLQNELDMIDAEIKMFEFRKDVFRAVSYKGI